MCPRPKSYLLEHPTLSALSGLDFMSIGMGISSRRGRLGLRCTKVTVGDGVLDVVNTNSASGKF